MRPASFSPRRVLRNWQLKLAALALAVLLWVLVRAEQPTEQWMQVRVEAQMLDPGYTLTAPPAPGLVQVRFAGKWREIGELALEKPVIVLHVRNVGQQRSFVLEPSMVRLPDGARGHVSAVDIRPALVKLALQPVTTPGAPPAR
ncbi:MAG TPA: hypothetical protein VK420_05335 [Longimicrobium sp.]|nr:hypothetical protein [Longimicrobium sp.]